MAVRSADYSPDGERVVIGQTNGEFAVLLAGDLSTLGKKRDRKGVIQVVR